MRILFLHRNFPGQFMHLARHLAQDRANRVVFITARRDRSIPNVMKAVYHLPERGTSTTHRYLRASEEAVIHGQATARAALDLKRKGFEPDVIVGHSWGQNLFMKDVFPRSPLVGYFEWFYRSQGSDVGFDPSIPVTLDVQAGVRVKNSHILMDLAACDQGVCPTRWQFEQFPPEFRHKIRIMHDGVGTDFFRPNPGARLVIPELGLDLSHADEIVTYVSRGLEPYRGFPQFMEACGIILDRRPHCHVVIVGQDRVFYGSRLPDGKTYKQQALDKHRLDTSRVHFTGYIPYDLYLRVLQASSAHVYLTYPFVLSWSMLEAMSAGCCVLASRTPPVQEVIEDGMNGILFDFFSPAELAHKVCNVLADQDATAPIRDAARRTILERYDLKDLLPRQVAFISDMAAGKGMS